jgi:hypothetical protein
VDAKVVVVAQVDTRAQVALGVLAAMALPEPAAQVVAAEGLPSMAAVAAGPAYLV